MPTKQPVEASWYDYPQYFDMAFRDETRLEADFIEAACRKYAPHPVRRLLEPGCGTGRLVAELAARGYDVTGIDLSEPSLAYLRRRLARRKLCATVAVGDMADFRLARPVDAAFSTFNTFRHLLTEAEARSHLECVARCLRPGGLYLLGFHLLPLDVSEESTERWTARHAGTKVTVTFRVLKTERRRRRETIRVNVLARTPRRSFRLRDEFPLRMYTAAQFRRLLRSVSAFELCDVYDFWYDIDDPLVLDDEITDTLFVLRKAPLSRKRERGQGRGWAEKKEERERMSNIVIIVDEPAISTSTLMELQHTTGRGLADIRSAISQGNPIFEQEIFNANYEEHASMIRAIVGCLESASVRSRIYELPEGETMGSCSFVDNCRISVEVLNNILNQADAELDGQLGERTD